MYSLPKASDKVMSSSPSSSRESNGVNAYLIKKQKEIPNQQ